MFLLITFLVHFVKSATKDIKRVLIELSKKLLKLVLLLSDFFTLRVFILHIRCLLLHF